MSRIILILIFAQLIFQSLNAQLKKGENLHRTVYISNNDTTYVANVYLVDVSVKTNYETRYHWFKNNELHSNVGGYTGKLLDGQFKKICDDGILIEQGSYLNGIKSGVWKNWNRKGDLLSIISYKQGLKHGFYKFYANASIIEEGNYKRNKKHSRSLVVNNDGSTEEVFYKNGIIIEASFLRKLFKKSSNSQELEEIVLDPIQE